MASTTSASSSAGIDVQTIVSQLMAIERKPIDDLNTRISSYQTKISSFGTISSLVSTFQSSLQGLTGALQSFSAISSDTSVASASADSTAVAGTYSLSVSSLAQAQNLVAAGQTSSTTAIGGGTSTTVSFDFGTISGGTLTNGTYSGASFASNGNGVKSITIDGTNNTLQGIRDTINAANLGVSASIVNDGSATPYRLVLTSSQTGASNSIKITTTGGDGSIGALLGYDPAGTQNLSQTTAAQNANFTVNGIAITSATNTTSTAIQGVNLVLNKASASAATVTVARDAGSMQTAAAKFVDAYNALATQLRSRSAYPSSKGATPPVLSGDGTVRLMIDQLRSILGTSATPASGGSLTLLAQVGITSKADGTLSIDTGKLSNAMSANFSDVANLFSGATGFATRLNNWAASALAPTGMIANRTDSMNTSIQRYTDQIGRLENRMTFLQKQYTDTYTRLNMALASMNSTSAYLTQQLSKG